MSFLRPPTHLLYAALLSTVPLQAPAEPWTVSPDFHGESSLDISGAICPTAALDPCYAVNDEKKYIQLFRIEGATIIPGERLRLIDKTVNGVEMDELDAEAIAYAEGFVYVIGSHGVTRTGAEIQPSRFFLTRFPVDASTGAPTFAVSSEITPAEVVRSAALSQILQDHGVLARHFHQPLDADGINIEGLAIDGGRAIIGLRQPALGTGVAVLNVGLDCLFDGAPCAPVFTLLPVGKSNAGIRDIARLGDRYLLLVATAFGDEEPTAAVWGWRGGVDAPERLVEIALPEGEKPEALMLLPGTETGGAIRALILFDGSPNGAPREITLPVPQLN